MEKYFNINIEFNKEKVNHIIDSTIKKRGRGYVCSVEGNILATANTNKSYLEIINNSLVNICDGSSIATLASLIYGRKFSTYIGADLFIEYIKMAKYRSFFLGNTDAVLVGLKSKISVYDNSIEKMKFETLPFKDVNEFDYHEIAKMINENDPDIIWVSLGAPKQEIFMSKLLPHLNRGVMFGFGAIFNFYSENSEEKRAPKLFLMTNMEWVYRLMSSPKKQIPRIRSILYNYPKIIFEEVKNHRKLF